MTTNPTASNCSYSAPTVVSPDDNVKVGPLDKDGLNVKFEYSSACPPSVPSDGDTLTCHPSMKTPLELFVQNINHFSSSFGSYGPIRLIGHSGAQRYKLDYDKKGKLIESFHYEAKALDITWILWQEGNSSIYSLPCKAADEAKVSTNHRRLTAVEAGLRKWFGYVLNRGITNHHNHFHVDNGCHVALRIRAGGSFRRNTSCHYFLQDCINAFTDETVTYDGIWGDASKQGYRRLLSDLGMECLDPAMYINHYMIFLDFIMMHGFGNVSAGAYRWGDNVVL